MQEEPNYPQYSQWTLTAIECYERGCRCNGCNIPIVLETQCLMKLAVRQLVKNFGRPTEQIKKILTAKEEGRNKD